MKQHRIVVLVLGGVTAMAGSATGQPLILPDTTANASAANATDNLDKWAPLPLLQPTGVDAPDKLEASHVEQLPLGKSGPLSLAELEQLALTSNPTIAQAAARVAALRGHYLQVGLPPNPTTGYLGEEIGNNHAAGQQGGYIGQEFITGGKLRLNRAVVSQQIQQAERWLEATRLRVLTDVRLAYYAALVAKNREDLANDLAQISGKSVADTTRLKGVGEAAKTDVLTVEVEQRIAQIVVATARTEKSAAWHRLSAVVGVDVPPGELTGDLSKLPALLNFDDQLARLNTYSPEVAAAFAEVGRAEFALSRARREPIPNVSTQVSVQHDNSTGDTFTGVNVGIPLPVWNRNQGGIRQSQAEVLEARRNLDRVQLNLKNRLAIAFQRYAAAQERVRIYSDEVIPKAEENFKLVRGAFPAQVGSLEYLTAQRTYFQTRLSYLEALAELWASWNEINGLLLSNSLIVPPDTWR